MTSSPTPWAAQPGHPMLRVDRLYSDTFGRPVELSVSHFLPEQYTYRVTLRRSGKSAVGGMDRRGRQLHL